MCNRAPEIVRLSIMIRLLRSCSRISYNTRQLHNSNCLSSYYEEKKGGYEVVHDKLLETKKVNIFGKLRNGCREIKKECSLLRKEIREHFSIHNTWRQPCVEDIVWKFDETEKSRYQWVLTCDSDYNQGYSNAKLEVSPRSTGIFHGVLSTRVPKDGEIRYAGYCNITTVQKLKSFKRKDVYDWSDYNCLVLRIRGDGRCYVLNILQRQPIDILWHDTYHYVLYTRGGPYWQHVKLPFSKFAFASKGGMMDGQKPLPEYSITNFGITLADRKNGPFRLEIDYIGVCYDPYHTETFAYEMCNVGK